MKRSLPTTFHAFTIKTENGIANKIITPIKILEAFDPENIPTPLPAEVETTALWDTGATNSVIAESIVHKLNLQPIGTTYMTHAGGSNQCYKYLINIWLPNQVGLAGIEAIGNNNLVSGFEVIIGMDIISQGDFSITNVDRKTVMSFRTPSISHIDYVNEANKLRFSGIGPNDPCPCGAKDINGKPIKFKRCHKLIV